MVVTIGLLRRWSSPSQDASYRKEVQIDVLIDQCRRNGWEWRIYDEGQVSGQYLEKRQKAQELLADLKAGRIQGLGALDLKRVTRDRIGIDRATIKGIIVEARAILVTRDKIYDLRKPDDAMMYDVVGALAGHEITTIRNTFWDGNVVRRISGAPSNCAAAPVGYHHVPDGPIRPDGRVSRRLVKNPDEESVVHQFWDIAASAPSTAFVTTELNRSGVPYPRPRNRVDGGVWWSGGCVQGMIRNWIYSGIQVVGRLGKSDVFDLHPLTRGVEATIHGGVFERDVPEWRYVPLATQRAVVERMDRNRLAVGRRGVNEENPLAGILRCAHCGGPMYQLQRKYKLRDGTIKDSPGYRCAEREFRRGTCPGQVVTRNLALRGVLDCIQGLLSDNLLDSHSDEVAGTDDPSTALDDVRGRLSVLEVKHRKVLERELLAESQEETAALATIRRETEVEMRACRREVEVLTEAATSQDMQEQMRELGTNFTSRLLLAPWYLQRRVIGAFLAEVRVGSGKQGVSRPLPVVAYRLAWSDVLVEVSVNGDDTSRSPSAIRIILAALVLRGVLGGEAVER